MSQSLKKRTEKGTGKKASPQPETYTDDDLNKTKAYERAEEEEEEPNHRYWVAMILVTLLAIYVRFNKIGTPDKVVFDEVHFGKFASYYLERTYFFDLHPPFAKLLIAFAGWIVGYDGSFKFENIGDNYISHGVPYIAYRSLLGIQGTLVVPIVFWTMKTLKFSVPACLLSSILICFDNAHVVDSRLILLDATLILSVALTIYLYVKFSTYRRQPFTRWWWIWLTLTGVSLSCVISTKYVGVFTYVTIGIGVLHELWILLDYKKGLTIPELAKHFFARLWSLIVFPFCIYLFWFYLHFAILNKSGPGDSFMSSDFQETLIESPLARLSKTVNYYDIITIRHKETDSFLHSHEAIYPLRYEDGRISSHTQQVTCVFDPESKEAEDVNNQWEIVPTKENLQFDKGVAVFTNDIVRFRHIGTGGYLLTHDVASPLKATNEEFTIVHGDDAEEKYNETLFRLRFSQTGSGTKNKRKVVKSKATPLKIIHVDTVVAMWTHDDELLPEWGFGHQEVSGNKKIQDRDNSWYFDDIVNLDEEDPRHNYVPKVVKHRPFLQKWWELQGLMFYHNNLLSSEHPFASQPDAWPLALSGVSFWNDNDERKQIFFIGNVIGFWTEVGFLAIYLGLLLADQVTRRRNVHILSNKARSRLYNTLGFFFAGWAAHYFPFYLMNRQKFLHHYLPAHLIAAMFTGGLVEFLFSKNSTTSNRLTGANRLKATALVLVISIGVIWFFFYFRPITYGDISIAPEEIKKRQWLDIKLHYAK